MSRLIHHHHGGRQRRYKANPGRLLGLLCPFERKPLSFRNEWVYELWLCRRADPSVLRVVIGPEPLQFLVRGQCLSGAADLAVWRPDGVTYEAVVRGTETEWGHRWDALRGAGEAHGVRVCFTNPRELLDRRQLIDNMDRARQTLVAWLDYDFDEVCARMCEALRVGPLTRAQLRAAADSSEDGTQSDRADVCIYRLFFERKVSLDLNRRYDDDCIVASL